MEMVFRRIDYWFEGDHQRQKKLKTSPWTREKVLRKSAKYVVSFVVAFLVANAFVAYIVGVTELYHVVTHSPSEHMAAFTAVMGFSFLFYWIFVWFREQACILVCPYGRLQGVLLDRRSIVIAYDYVRGEPRGKLRRDQRRSEGDCIDCHLCVDVCPTGIDIRNGTQLECVNCTACIDACDAVMEKIKRPRRLIRYDSAEGIATKSGFRWTPRVIGYSAVLVVLVSLVSSLLLTRTDFDITILRTPGMFYQELPDGRVSNVYDVKVLNKTFEPVSLTLRLQQPAGEIQVVGNDIAAEAQKSTESKVLLVLDRAVLTGLSTPVTLEVYTHDQRIEVMTTSFLGPGARR
jgi:cytochrome c oxidase accessory protein FixG